MTHPLDNIEPAEIAWQSLSRLLVAENCSYAVHHAAFTSLFPTWPMSPDTAPAWIPDATHLSEANITTFMTELNIHTVPDFHAWTRECYTEFWEKIIAKLPIVFKKPAERLCDLTDGVTSPKWLPGVAINIADSCFTADPDNTAILYEDDQQSLHTVTYRELDTLSNRIANSLVAEGFKQGDAIAIAMPMNHFAVAIFLGIIKMGGAVVSIADSFSPEEITVRLNIAKAKAIFTQDVCPWANKLIPLYEKITKAKAPRAFVLTHKADAVIDLRPEDKQFNDMLVTNTQFTSTPCHALDACNILFSSGTTADPKAIPWNHTTPIKAASDAFFHQNIKSGDILTWPTNLGWMMGPWLVFAALINRATIALYSGAPKGREFGEFVTRTKVTMLGVVPTLVSYWKQTRCMEGLDWSQIKTFTSTGECSNPEDMFYLMWLGQYKPVIEYCGGTEIGGAYLSSTVIEKNYPSLFTTPTMGSDFAILNEAGEPADMGEVAIIPPSIGLSVELLNADHDKVYYNGMPTFNGIPLRRHGDQICRYPNHTYSILGRVDDTMNLGGIKVSAAEIERALADIDAIFESAAIAVKPAHNGPSQLIIYAVATNPPDKSSTMKMMQQRINQHLNPLFRIQDLIFVSELPKTASNKIMRRVLRNEYTNKHHAE